MRFYSICLIIGNVVGMEESNRNEKKTSIEPTGNGPYLVRNLTHFWNSKGEPIEIKMVMTLCRCGGSNNKPFCDGTHLKNNLSDK